MVPRAGLPPTRRQLETLCAYIDAGSIKAAASQLGITETTARQNLSALYRRTGSVNAAQAAFLLRRVRHREVATRISTSGRCPRAASVLECHLGATS
jgi:predicted ArsR family transcriptional regulator